MLELWKPIKVKKDNDSNIKGPVIFDVFGDVIPKPYRPFIIFYDDQQDCYWYLRARSVLGRKKVVNQEAQTVETVSFERTQLDTEIKCKYSDEGLFREDSYVDTAQIFKCNREVLEELVKNDELYDETRNLNKLYKYQILEQLKDNIFEVPPYLSIVEIGVDKNNHTYGESLYLNEDLMDREMPIDRDGSILISSPEAFLSRNKKNSFEQERFMEGIQFCEMFLKEYFPEELDEFRNLQDLKKSSTLDNEEDSKLEI